MKAFNDPRRNAQAARKRAIAEFRLGANLHFTGGLQPHLRQFKDAYKAVHDRLYDAQLTLDQFDVNKSNKSAMKQAKKFVNRELAKVDRLAKGNEFLKVTPERATQILKRGALAADAVSDPAKLLGAARGKFEKPVIMTGEKGGKYTVTKSGKKRYLRK